MFFSFAQTKKYLETIGNYMCYTFDSRYNFFCLTIDLYFDECVITVIVFLIVFVCVPDKRLACEPIFTLCPLQINQK